MSWKSTIQLVRRRSINVLIATLFLSTLWLYSNIEEDADPSQLALQISQQAVEAVAHVQAFAFGHSIPSPQHFTSASTPKSLEHYFSSNEFDFSDHPLSSFRPRNQFQPDRVQVGLEKASIVIVTATRNPVPDHIWQAYQSIAQQSLQTFNWLIVDDHTDHQASLDVLHRLASLDSRIILIRNEGESGLPASRNVGLDYLSKNPLAPYISVFDDDDMYELTCLEKSIWTLISNPTWSLAAFYFVKFGHQESMETRGPHMAAANLYSNHVPGPTVFRANAVQDCRYDNTFKGGGEDWDFWLCLYQKGHWGGTRQEVGYWYRIRSAEENQQRWPGLYTSFDSTKHRILDKHGDSLKDLAPADTKHSEPMEAVTMDIPITNALHTTESMAILLIVSTLSKSSSGSTALQLIRLLARAGWRVTVVVSQTNPIDAKSLIPAAMASTHDIHVLPQLVRLADFPRYITYLAESRSASTALMFNSQLAYELLPVLSASLPYLRCIDFIQNQPYSTWRSDGFPAYSLASRRYLHRTLVSSAFLRDWLVSNDYAPGRVGTLKLPIIPQGYTPATPVLRENDKAGFFNATNYVVTIVSIVRLEEKRRPLLLPAILSEAMKLLHKQNSDIKIKLAVVGDGPLQKQVQHLAEELNLSESFSMHNTAVQVDNVLAASDIFLLPSFPHSVSVAIMEAQAMGLPILTSASMDGQLGDNTKSEERGTILVAETGNDQEDVEAFAIEMVRLVQDQPRRNSLGAMGREFVMRNDHNIFPSILITELEQAKAWSKHALQHLPHPAAALSVAHLLLDDGKDADLADVQLKIQPLSRTGRALELQLRCTETSPEHTLWIEHVVKPTSCWGDGMSFANLSASALHQCGAWCLFDYSTTAKVGWHFQGDCWTAIQPLLDGRPHECEKWWVQHEIML